MDDCHHNGRVVAEIIAEEKRRVYHRGDGGVVGIRVCSVSRTMVEWVCKLVKMMAVYMEMFSVYLYRREWAGMGAHRRWRMRLRVAFA